MKKKRKNHTLPKVGTSALPDIVFMLLFFFAVVMVMRKHIIKVEISLPRVSEAKKMNHKSLINHIYVGQPIHSPQVGDPKIQINDAFVHLDEIPHAMEVLDASRPESLLPKVQTALIVDEEANMGVVGDVKVALRKANRLKVIYEAMKDFE